MVTYHVTSPTYHITVEPQTNNPISFLSTYDIIMNMVDERELLEMAYEMERRVEGLDENKPVPANIEKEVKSMAEEMLRKLD